nr:hypothetical protein SHINE37_40802 [Rhizobiaceae bacterium]
MGERAVEHDGREGGVDGSSADSASRSTVKNAGGPLSNSTNGLPANLHPPSVMVGLDPTIHAAHTARMVEMERSGGLEVA